MLLDSQIVADRDNSRAREQQLIVVRNKLAVPAARAFAIRGGDTSRNTGSDGTLRLSDPRGAN